MRSKPYGDPSMGLRWPRAECYDAQGPPWLYPQKVQSRAMTLLGERPTGQKRTQRAASLILGQPPRRSFACCDVSNTARTVTPRLWASTSALATGAEVKLYACPRLCCAAACTSR